jgi:hypothetical protein
MENDPLLASLVEEAVAKGLPMPLNWVVTEEESDTSDDEYEESDQDEELEDSDSPEEQESIQAEDDPEEKEVRDDCDSQTTEDCHGGNEATRSVEDSPSVAEDGQEDRDSDQTEDGGDEGEGEGEDGQSGETTHSSDNGQNSGENGSGSGEEGEEGTSSGSGDSQGESGSNKLVAALLTALREKKEQADAKAAEDKAFREDPEMVDWVEAEKKITETIVQICEQDCGRIKNAPTSWDTRAMSRDVAIGRWDRVLRDKKWSLKPRKLVIFWDQSGSCDSYISAVHNALKTVAELGYRCTLFDASNGIEQVESVVWVKTGPHQTTDDYYQNGPRLRKVAKDIGAKTDSNIICPSIADFIKICEKADVVMVLQDYDCVEPLFKAASKVSRRKCPHFIDLETRYDEPYEHSWNPGMCKGQKYAVQDRWHRIWDVRDVG